MMTATTASSYGERFSCCIAYASASLGRALAAVPTSRFAQRLRCPLMHVRSHAASGGKWQNPGWHGFVAAAECLRCAGCLLPFCNRRRLRSSPAPLHRSLGLVFAHALYSPAQGRPTRLLCLSS